MAKREQNKEQIEAATAKFSGILGGDRRLSQVLFAFVTFQISAMNGAGRERERVFFFFPKEKLKIKRGKKEVKR